MQRTALILSIPLLFHLTTALSLSQLSAQLPVETADIQLRKLYLHTDREYYFAGDTLWFKGYYLDGRTHQLLPGYLNMYTGLYDEWGNKILQQVLRIGQGIVAGSLNIPDTLEPGYYLLRAFTGEQEPMGEDAFFHKTLRISKVRSTLAQLSEQTQNKVQEIDLAVLPEGGILLADIQNVVAIKATDAVGRDLQVNGTITDGRGNQVAAFTTTYRGMDTVHLRPKAGEAYYLHIEGYPGFEKVMEKPAESGIKIGLSRESGDELLFSATANSEDYIGKEFYFAIMQGGGLIFDQRFRLSNHVFPIKVNRTALPPGINRFILLDEGMKPISERLFFSGQMEINPVRVVPDRQQYGTRSPVSIELFDAEETGGNAFSHLSMSVVDEKAVPENGPGVNILSWLLVSSELKGRIDSPAGFFRDDEHLTSAEKLDLLMLTHGWSRYIYNDLPGLEAVAESAGDEGMLHDGFSISGTVTNPLTNRPVQDADVLMSIFNPDFFILDETVTDGEGRFLLENVVFEDSATAFVQARNRRGNLYTNITLDPILKPFPELPGQYLPVEGSVREFLPGLNEQQYYNDRALQEYLIKSGAILLEEVTIVEQRREEDDGHFRIYPKPASSLKITERDIGYSSVTDYLQGRVSGVIIVGDAILIRGLGSFRPGPPLFVLDGTPLIGEGANEIINSIPMSNIDVVEVLKNANEAAIFGVNAGNGVISIFTKKGVEPFDDTFRQGTITRKIEGYAPYREFYSPAYTADNMDSERPDQRITLFWDPAIMTGEGKATLSFYTSDDVARYRVLVEGITQTGEICMGNASFVVQSDRSVLTQ